MTVRGTQNLAPGWSFAGSGTWANAPSASAYSGYLYYATDIGADGVLLRSNGTRWKVANGTANLKSGAAVVSGITNTEQIVLQTLLPINAWQQFDSIRLFLNTGKSGATDTARITVRIGTAGTTADTAITGLSVAQLMTAAGLASGMSVDIKLLTATSAQKIGSAQNGAVGYADANAVAASAATTITDASANALYVSLGLSSSGATDTLTFHGGNIQMVSA